MPIEHTIQDTKKPEPKTPPVVNNTAGEFFDAGPAAEIVAAFEELAQIHGNIMLDFANASNMQTELFAKTTEGAMNNSFNFYQDQADATKMNAYASIGSGAVAGTTSLGSMGYSKWGIPGNPKLAEEKDILDTLQKDPAIGKLTTNVVLAGTGKEGEAKSPFKLEDIAQARKDILNGKFLDGSDPKARAQLLKAALTEPMSDSDPAGFSVEAAFRSMNNRSSTIVNELHTIELQKNSTLEAGKTIGDVASQFTNGTGNVLSANAQALQGSDKAEETENSNLFGAAQQGKQTADQKLMGEYNTTQSLYQALQNVIAQTALRT